MLDLSPVEVFFLQRPVVIDKKSSMLKRIMFYMKVFVDPFLIVVLRPWRKTPGSPSTEDGGRNNGGITSFFTEHGNQSLHFHQGFRGEGRIVDVVSCWSKRSPPLLTFPISSRTPVAHSFLPCPQDELADFHETALLRRFSSQSLKAEDSS